MDIEIEAPDGTIVTFPAGTPESTIVDVMAKNYPKTQAYEAGAPVNATPGAEMRAYEPSWRDRLGGAIGDTLSSLGISQGVASDTARGLVGSAGAGQSQMGLVDLVPGPSNALAFDDMRRDFDAGRVGSGILNAIGAGLGPAGAGAKAAIPSADRLSMQAERINAMRAPGAPEITIPRALDPNPDWKSRAASEIAKRQADTPIVGPVFKEKVWDARGAIGENIEANIRGAGPQLPNQVSGDEAADAARRWISEVSKPQVDAAFKAARDTIPEGFRGKMPNLQSVFNDLSAEDAAAFINTNKPVLDMVRKALESPEGITPEGAQALKQALSRLAKPGMAVAEAATAQPGFKRAAGALAKDIDAMIQTAGGKAGTEALRIANETFLANKPVRDAIYKVLGKGATPGNVSGEQVIARIEAMAKEKSGDAARLFQIKAAIPDKEWSQVARTIHENMGATRDGFDPNTWSKNWEKLSTNGKNALFGPEQVKALDDLARLQSDFMEASKNIGNPSGSGSALQGVGFVAALYHSPIKTIRGVLGGAGFMQFMGNPRAVKAVTKMQEAMLRELPMLSRDTMRADINRVAKKKAMAKLTGLKAAAKYVGMSIGGEDGKDVNAALTQMLDAAFQEAAGY